MCVLSSLCPVSFSLHTLEAFEMESILWLCKMKNDRVRENIQDHCIMHAQCPSGKEHG